ncbi:tetratricopeptide repeat protein [Neptunitalea lumnitzerae]|nr:tetratricopeptide repeat protein [Neptunitalea sp. Y10]
MTLRKFKSSIYPIISILLFFCTLQINAQTSQELDSLIVVAVKEIQIEKKIPDAIKQLENIQEIAFQKNYSKQYILATNNLGMAYYLLLDYGNSIKYYLDAYNKILKDGDPTNEMMVLNNIAIVYASDENLNKAEAYFKKAYDIAINQQSKVRTNMYASNLAKLNFEMGAIDKAKEYVDITLKTYDAQECELSSKLNALITQNQILLLEKKYNEVIENSLQILKQAEKHHLSEPSVETEIILSKAYLKINNWEKASLFISKGIADAPNDAYKLDLYELKSQLALATNNIRQIYAVKNSMLQLTNSIHKSKNRELLETSKLQFELASSKHDLVLNKEKSAAQKNIYIILTISLVFILLVVSWAFRKKTQVDAQKIVLAESNLKISDLELEKEKQKTAILNQKFKEKELLNALEKEKLKEKENQLKQEIEKGNKKLSDKILFQSTRNELIEDIIQTISNLPDIKKNDELSNSINNLKSHLKEATKWDEFTSSFENVNTKFLNRLKQKHPNLNANDIRFLSFIYLNLSYKEIATLLNITPDSCRKRKERVSKKMGLDSGKSLFEYLSKI